MSRGPFHRYLIIDTSNQQYERGKFAGQAVVVVGLGPGIRKSRLTCLCLRNVETASRT